jgi:hypothetical protein
MMHRTKKYDFSHSFVKAAEPERKLILLLFRNSNLIHLMRVNET